MHDDTAGELSSGITDGRVLTVELYTQKSEVIVSAFASNFFMNI